MFDYVQLNKDGVVVGVSRLAGIVKNPMMIQVPGADKSYIGKRWNGSEFVEAEPAEQSAGPLSRLEFMDRFTDQEMAGIYAAADSKALVKVWVKRLEAASKIDMTDQRTIDGINALETAGLIAAGRAAEILAP